MSGYYIKGLGSMGKRRIRCLMALGVKPEEIWGNDVRKDRCAEAEKKYGINIIKDENDEAELDFEKIKAVIVSLPPDKHKLGVEIAAKHGKPVFVEASVVLDDVLAIKDIGKDIFVAPSCTFIFHPMIKEVKRIVTAGILGKVCNFSYHSGQYLPDWHTWESVNDFYVSKRETGGAREIVPYELTWIVDTFGFPKDIKGYFRKTGNVGCNIEDSYVSSLDYGDMVGGLLVDVVSRYPARNLIINFQNGQIQWRWDSERLEIYNATTQKTDYIQQQKQAHEAGYSNMVIENMYVEEIQAFLAGIADNSAYPNTLEKDIQVLRLLNRIEETDGGF